MDVDLIYLDPPFNSNRNYHAIYNETGRLLPAQLDAFCNIWTLDDEQIVSFVRFGGIIVNMDYIEEIGKTLFKLLFSYKGRVSRLTYWLYPVYSLGTWALVLGQWSSFYRLLSITFYSSCSDLCVWDYYMVLYRFMLRGYTTQIDRVGTFLCVLPR